VAAPYSHPISLPTPPPTPVVFEINCEDVTSKDIAIGELPKRIKTVLYWIFCMHGWKMFSEIRFFIKVRCSKDLIPAA